MHFNLRAGFDETETLIDRQSQRRGIDCKRFDGSERSRCHLRCLPKLPGQTAALEIPGDKQMAQVAAVAQCDKTREYAIFKSEVVLIARIGDISPYGGYRDGFEKTFGAFAVRCGRNSCAKQWTNAAMASASSMRAVRNSMWSLDQAIEQDHLDCIAARDVALLMRQYDHAVGFRH